MNTTEYWEKSMIGWENNFEIRMKELKSITLIYFKAWLKLISKRLRKLW